LSGGGVRYTRSTGAPGDQPGWHARHRAGGAPATTRSGSARSIGWQVRHSASVGIRLSTAERDMAAAGWQLAQVAPRERCARCEKISGSRCSGYTIGDQSSPRPPAPPALPSASTTAPPIAAASASAASEAAIRRARMVRAPG
jgi:hypothetical protein